MKQILALGLMLSLSLTSLVIAQNGEPTKQADSIPATGVENPHLASFDTMMVEFLREHDVPGGSLAVSRNGVLVYARGFGLRDKEKNLPVEPTTRFRIASISKPITAAAILLLVKQKKISLDDVLSDFLAGSSAEKLHPQLEKITVRQLLQHRAGWDREKSFDPMFKTVMISRELNRKLPANQADIIEYMLKRPPDFEPGSQYAYSNFGYCLLGRIIERASKQPYDKYVQKEIFTPLRIKSPTLAQSLEQAEGESRYYPRHPRKATGVVPGVIGKQVPVQYGGWNIENMDSHGGWIASAPDLVRFADAFNSSRKRPLLTNKLRDEMFGPATEDTAKDVFYGLGWQVRKVQNGASLNTWHTGGLDGTSTILVRRSDGLNWAVLFNSDFGKDRKRLASLIDPLVHKAANQVHVWPKKPVRLE